MKRVVYFLVMIFCSLGIFGFIASEAKAIEAYFDSEISTSLEYQPATGMLLIRMLDEEVLPVLQDVMYERMIFVEIILDASKTMGEPDINGIPKIDIARKLVSVLVKNFPQRDTRFALRVNGAKYANNCLDSELVVPFSRENGQQILDAVGQIQPTGLSPLTYSLRQVLQDFEGKEGGKIVFIITDGIETCDIEPVDACTVTMDMLLEAEFEGSINILGINTVYETVQDLLSCITARGKGEFLDSNRDSGRQFGRLIQNSSQLVYSISRVLDPETLAEGKILELLNRTIGDSSIIEGKEVVLQPRSGRLYSRHELEPGIYKIEFATVPALVSYFTIDQQQELTIGVVRSGLGFDLYDRAYLALGNRYYDNGQIEQALVEYQKVIDLDPRNVDAHLNMGIIYQDILRDNEKAATHYKMYLELQGPRHEEVAAWLREVRGLPTEEEELEQRRQEIEEQRKREEAERLAAAEEAQRQRERQKAIAAYNEILTANPNIRSLSQESVISGDLLEIVVSTATSDAKAEEIALDVGGRMHSLLNRQPDILIYRENKPEEPIKQAQYDASQRQYRIGE